MGDTPKQPHVTLPADILAWMDAQVDRIVESTKRRILSDPRATSGEWSENDTILHHFVMVMNVCGEVIDTAIHALASCDGFPDEETNYYLDDWSHHMQKAAEKMCEADFKIAAFVRLKQHDGDCEPPPGEKES